jgi:hypothetical protein
MKSTRAFCASQGLPFPIKPSAAVKRAPFAEPCPKGSHARSSFTGVDDAPSGETPLPIDAQHWRSRSSLYDPVGVPMGTTKRLTLARREKILDRQDPPGWGADYVPSILATREEAPSISRPRQIWSDLLGRYCHVLSEVEARAIVLALHHPRLFELQEQRMLSCEPSLHPLARHPIHAVHGRNHFKGTLNVAERLGVLTTHPIVHFTEGGQAHVTAFPFVGDLLLFMFDEQGPYCVNWTIKLSEEAFRAPIRTDLLSANPERAAADVQARHAIEEIYYQDASIRTQRVVERDIDRGLFATLNHLLLWSRRRACVDITDEMRGDILDRFRGCMASGRPPLDEMLILKRDLSVSLEDLKALLFRAIWRRELRVDLWSGIFVDRPLKPEIRDVLTHYSTWFARGDTHE